MEDMINIDGLYVTTGTVIEYLYDRLPDAAPTEGVMFFAELSESWRGKYQEAEEAITRFLGWIENGKHWSADRNGEVEVLDSFPCYCPDFVAFDEWEHIIAIDKEALKEYLEHQVNYLGWKEELEEWVRAQKHLKEGEDWKIAPPEDADEKEGDA